jgi:NitT/TauT family transport system substrate-binding protein
LEAVWSQYSFSLSLDQTLVVVLEDEARWIISNGLTDERSVPNFLNSIYADGLRTVKPDALRIAGK